MVADGFGLIVDILPYIATIIAAWLVVNFAAGYLVVKDLLVQLSEITRTLDAMMQEVVVALEDDEISEDEFRVIFNRLWGVFEETQKFLTLLTKTSPWGMVVGIFRPEYRAALAQAFVPGRKG
ncbi:MAG: hypothetical protein WC145_07430 [Aliarcobacter sp.]